LDFKLQEQHAGRKERLLNRKQEDMASTHHTSLIFGIQKMQSSETDVQIKIKEKSSEIFQKEIQGKLLDFKLQDQQHAGRKRALAQTNTRKYGKLSPHFLNSRHQTDAKVKSKKGLHFHVHHQNHRTSQR